MVQQETGAVAGIQNRSRRLMVSSPRSGVMSTLMLWNWIRRVGALQPWKSPGARQAHCLSTVVQTITFATPILQKNLH